MVELTVEINETETLEISVETLHFLGFTDHAKMTNRDAKEQHPIEAITGLAEKLKAQDEAISKQAETATAQGETLSQQAKVLSSHGEALTTHGEALAQHREAINAQGKTISSHGETLTQHTESINAHGETLSQHGQTIGERARCGNCALSCVISVTDYHNECRGGKCTCCNDWCYRWTPENEVSKFLREQHHYDDSLYGRLENIFGDGFLRECNVPNKASVVLKLLQTLADFDKDMEVWDRRADSGRGERKNCNDPA